MSKSIEFQCIGASKKGADRRTRVDYVARMEGERPSRFSRIAGLMLSFAAMVGGVTLVILEVNGPVSAVPVSPSTSHTGGSATLRPSIRVTVTPRANLRRGRP
jgi:hypothetical protein